MIPDIDIQAVLNHKHHCPNCLATYACCCESCDEDKGARWAMINDLISCLSCGFTASMDWWLDEEVRQLTAITHTKTLSDAVEVMEKLRAARN